MPMSFIIFHVKQFNNGVVKNKLDKGFSALTNTFQVMTTNDIRNDYNITARIIRKKIAKNKLKIVGKSYRQNVFRCIDVHRAFTKKVKRKYFFEWDIKCWITNHRTYSKYVSWSKEKRDKILLDGEPSVEVDIDNCHVRFLWLELHNRLHNNPQADKELQSFNFDLYTDVMALYNCDREEAKDRTLKWIYGHKVAGKRIQTYIDSKYPLLSKEIHTIKTNIYDVLVKHEAAIMNNIKTFIKKNYSFHCIHIHDGLRVPISKESIVRDIFNDEFVKWGLPKLHN
jgi:hypothetical protein